MADQTLLIVLSIANLIISAFTPVLSSVAYFISHVKSSECCGNKVLLRKDSEIVKKINRDDIV